MITKKSSDLVPLTRELAIRFSTMTALPGERDKKPARLKIIANLVKEGRFCSPTWDIAVIQGTDQELRVNGQHTSTVLASLKNEEFPKDMVVTITRWEIDAEDRGKLFKTFDSPISIRNSVDCIGTDMVDHPDLDAIPRKFLHKVLGGISFYTKDLNRSDGGIRTEWEPREVAAYFHEEENRRFAMWIHEQSNLVVRLAHKPNSWMFTKPGIIAEMLADWKSNSELAMRFWQLVLTESHPDMNHLTRVLSKEMASWNTTPRPKQEKYRIRAQKAWQRFRREEKKAAMATPESTYVTGEIEHSALFGNPGAGIEASL